MMEQLKDDIRRIQERIATELRGVPTSRTATRNRLTKAIDALNDANGQLTHYELNS